jgi:protein-L-isoaspartate(D-aspartate) O-methyltransferase
MTPAERQMRFVFTLRAAGVKDQDTLKALEAVPRDVFLGATFKHKAYEDTALPIECGQTISSPSVVGLMTQALDLTPRAKVLEIGTGSGYQAAILSCLSRRVYTLERHKELANLAKERLAHLNMSNVMVICDDGTKGLAQQAPFDRIIVTAAAEDVPAPLIGQLREGGVLVMPVGPKDQTQTLIKVIKSDTGLEYIELNKVRFVPLVST